jgi:hypothetical protein
VVINFVWETGKKTNRDGSVKREQGWYVSTMVTTHRYHIARKTKLAAVSQEEKDRMGKAMAAAHLSALQASLLFNLDGVVSDTTWNNWKNKYHSSPVGMKEACGQLLVALRHAKKSKNIRYRLLFAPIDDDPTHTLQEILQDIYKGKSDNDESVDLVVSGCDEVSDADDDPAMHSNRRLLCAAWSLPDYSEGHFA